MTLRPSSVSAATGDDLDVGAGNPAQVAQLAVGVAHHHDRVGRTAARQARVAHRGGRGRPGRHPDRGCWGGVCGGGHRRGLHGFRVFKRTRPCYRGGYLPRFSLTAGPGLRSTNSASASVSTVSPSLSRPDTKIFRPSTRSTRRVDLQLLFDRDDLAVIDVQVRGALAWAAGDHPRRHTQNGVEQQPERAAVHGAVAARDETAGNGPSPRCGRRPSCAPSSVPAGCCRGSASPCGGPTASPTRRCRTG